MACIGSSTGLCARVHEKLCQFGKSAPVKKELSAYIRIKTARNLNQVDNTSENGNRISRSIIEKKNASSTLARYHTNTINLSNIECKNSVNASHRNNKAVSVLSIETQHKHVGDQNYDSCCLCCKNYNLTDGALLFSSNFLNSNNSQFVQFLKTESIAVTNNVHNHIQYNNINWNKPEGKSQSTVWSNQTITRKLNNFYLPLLSLTSTNSSLLSTNHLQCGQSQKNTLRFMSTMRSSQQSNSLPKYQINPYRLIDEDLKEIYEDIRLLIRNNTNNEELYAVGTYYFDGQGKAFRPMVAILMARALNNHLNKEKSFLRSQKEVAMISEMIHIASLIHDDVIDQAELRRGKPSANVLWNQKKVTMAGDFILAVASMMIARLRQDDVTLTLSAIITDLIQGEFMQLGSKETENERFAHYLTKTYRKTASLIANSLKSVAMLAEADEQTCELAYQYGRNLGLAFQLVDDMLDFVSSAEEMGKPAAADLKLGLATAPVLFACEKYPELTPMIMRRFAEPGDCERAFELVHKSQGLKQTQFLAQQHGMEAARLANTITPSPHQKALIVLTDFVLNRMK